jgi:hypothetical protein
MLIEVRTDDNVQGSKQLSDEVKTVVQTTLDRFGDRIRRVDVYLSDATGNKAGHDDKCCKIEARRDGREPIIVTHHETTMDQAIRGAPLRIELVIGGHRSSMSHRAAVVGPPSPARPSCRWSPPPPCSSPAS